MCVDLARQNIAGIPEPWSDLRWGNLLSRYATPLPPCLPPKCDRSLEGRLIRWLPVRGIKNSARFRPEEQVLAQLHTRHAVYRLSCECCQVKPLQSSEEEHGVLR